MANPLSTRRSRKPRTSWSRLSPTHCAISDLNEFSALSLYDSATAQNNTLGNAYLLALSTGFYKYAKTKAQEFGTATDAELTLVLNRISDDLADDGRLQPGPFIGEFVTAIRSLSPETIAANLRSRSLVDYPQGLGVPDISVFLDLCAGTFDCPWSAGAPMPSAFDWPHHRRARGKIYVFGGALHACPLCRLKRHEVVRVRSGSERVDAKASDAGGIDFNRGCRRPYHRRQDLRGHGKEPVSVSFRTSSTRTTRSRTSGLPEPLARRTGPTSRARSSTVCSMSSADTAKSTTVPVVRSDVRRAQEPCRDLRPGDRSLVDRRAASHGAHGGSSLRGRRSDLRVRGPRASAPSSGRSLTYNTTSNSWSAKSPMPNARYAFDCVGRRRCCVPRGRIRSSARGDRRHDRALRPVRGDMVLSDSPEDSALRTVRACRRQANHHDGRYDV